MNNTKTSGLSIKTLKPANFRVFLKQRSNHHQIQQSQRLPPAHTESSKDAAHPQLPLKSDHLTKMKEYVRTRIKTQANEGSQSRLHRIPPTSNVVKQEKATPINAIKAPNKTNQHISDFKVQHSSSQSDLKTSSKPTLPTLKQLQIKAQNLLIQKLNHCSASKANRNEQLQRQIKQLVLDIKGIEDVNPEGNSKAVAIINSKINLIQKIIAEHMAEADIAKKHLLSKIANKAKSRRLKTEEYERSTSPFQSYRDTEACREVVVSTSMNQQSYQSPQRPAYNIYKHQQRRFNADRDKQPLPRSSYNREFLLYDNAQESEILPVDNAIMGRSSSASMFRSSYRDSFGPKQTSRINIKELDACKNKIKNYPVDFSRRTRTYSGLIHYDICRNVGNSKRYQEIPKIRVSGKYLLSESRRQYTNQADKASPSLIKHQNLHKWHYRYKNAQQA